MMLAIRFTVIFLNGDAEFQNIKMWLKYSDDKIRGAVVALNQNLRLPHPCSSLQCIVELTSINLPLNYREELSLIQYYHVNRKNSWDTGRYSLEMIKLSFF